MSVYAVAGESECYNLVSGHAYQSGTDGSKHAPTLSRGYMSVTTGVSEIELDFGTAVSEVYIHMHLHQEDVSLNNYIDIKNAAGTETQYRIQIQATGEWKAQRYNGTTYDDLGTTSAPMFVNGKGDVDIHIITDNVTGVFEIYKDTVNVLNFSGDTDTPNDMGLIRFIGLPGGTEKMNVSQVIVANETLLNWKLSTLAPVSDGAHTSWTGDYTHVDEFAYNASDFVEINSINQLESFNLSDVNAAYSTYNVKGVVVAGRVSNDAGSSVADAQFLVSTGGLTFTSPNLSITKDGSEQSKQQIWETNPDTTNPWTIAEVNGLEAGIKSV